MKTLLKLLVVAAVMNGAYRFGMAEYRFSRLKDSTHSMLVLGTETPLEKLKGQILTKAATLRLPISAEGVSVVRQNVTTTAAVSYHEDIEVFPGFLLPREYSFTHEISAFR